ncbi:hypothetical protein K0M31_005504 [Melipona bicolor]|uniref:Uncharacterized protein n=1 Tax=Melipona bicolor TaxID=60889 RepID=A0AA40KMS3_9HYME|nr:hypothetical protein K0M31_005504 [Melipona bicolor]
MTNDVIRLVSESWWSMDNLTEVGRHPDASTESAIVGRLSTSFRMVNMDLQTEMPGNTTVGSTLLDEDLRRILQEREQECLQLQAMNSTPPPGRIYYVRSCRNINSSHFSKLPSLRIQVKVSCDQSFRLRVRTRKIAEDRVRSKGCKFLHVDPKSIRGLLRFVACKNANDTSL